MGHVSELRGGVSVESTRKSVRKRMFTMSGAQEGAKRVKGKIAQAEVLSHRSS